MPPSQTSAKPKPKNVLWIMCDQLRYDYLGCTGHPVLKTPNIDAMAKRGGGPEGKARCATATTA